MKKAITVNGLAKQYQLGLQHKSAPSFREMILGVIKKPLDNLKRLRGEGHELKNFWALNDINFDVSPGEVVGVIGRNGAGKSTLLKILSRITSPTKGEITYAGRIASLLEVGTGFHPELSGRENIFLNGSILGMSRSEIEAQIDAIVDFAEIDKFLDTPVKRYSSGMYVRLAFSVAAHLNPDILIVDEVLAVGDQAFQQKCLGKLKNTAETGRTVIFVSHNMTAIKNLCSRIIYLKDGKIEYDGAPEGAISKYLAADKSESSTWVDAENTRKHLKRLQAHDSTGKSREVFQYNEKIYISLSIKGMKLGNFTPAVRLTDVYGHTLFTSCDHDYLGLRSRLENEELVCEIPEYIIKPGEYVISGLLFINDEHGNWNTDEASIDISVSPESCPIDQNREGLIYPILNWRVKEKR